MIPDFQTIMLPLLRTLADGQVWTMRKLTGQLDYHFNLTPEARQQMLPSGQQTTFSNRVAWAKTHLKAAGLVEKPETRPSVHLDKWEVPAGREPASH